MSLPMKAVDRLFERLAATYGAQWVRQWADVPIQDVKTAWAHELALYTGSLDTLAWALENLPTRCPNVIEFKHLCRSAPAKPVPQLPMPKVDPERLAAELAKLAEARKVAASSVYRIDHKSWARALIAREKAGELLNMTVSRFAHEALRSERITAGEVA